MADVLRSLITAIQNECSRQFLKYTNSSEPDTRALDLYIKKLSSILQENVFVACSLSKLKTSISVKFLKITNEFFKDLSIPNNNQNLRIILGKLIDLKSAFDSIPNCNRKQVIKIINNQLCEQVKDAYHECRDLIDINDDLSSTDYLKSVMSLLETIISKFKNSKCILENSIDESSDLSIMIKEEEELVVISNSILENVDDLVSSLDVPLEITQFIIKTRCDLEDLLLEFDSKIKAFELSTMINKLKV